MAKTIVGELKDLFVKFGGDAADLTGNETTAEMIDALEKVYEDKGDTLPEVTADDNGKVLSVVEGEWDKADASALPEVTADDNGDVLTVVNGEWDKAAASALPDVSAADNGFVLSVVNGAWTKAGITTNDFVVTYTPNYQTGSATANKSYSDIMQASAAGKNIVAKIANSSMVLTLTGTTSTGALAFGAMQISGGIVSVNQISHSYTGTITFETYALQKLGG